ncbi:Uncharacterised protein [Pluralibacter gergoviae]|nr:Uncharacterised protein [Pluralibacter gergoviae]
MRYQHLDLNLLVALDVLLDEHNITRAAGRLHMTPIGNQRRAEPAQKLL